MFHYQMDREWGQEEEKRAGLEMGRRPRVAAISEFIENEFARLGSAILELPRVEAPIEKLNELFRDTLSEVWDGGAVWLREPAFLGISDRSPLYLIYQPMLILAQGLAPQL